MTSQSIKDKVYDVLRQGYFNGRDDSVDVSDGPSGDIHVVIVSRKFDGRRMREGHDLIWDELTRGLAPEEWGQVSLTIGTSPEQAKAVG